MFLRVPVFWPFLLLEREDVEDGVCRIHRVGDQVGPERLPDDRLQRLPLGVSASLEQIVLALWKLGLHERHRLWIMEYGV